jgi:ribonucleoside-diphosphate reductase alpha chain
MNSQPITGEAFVPRRRRLADERKAITHKFQIGPCEGYLTVGLYEDGQPGEIFITLTKEGSGIAGLVDSFATAISISLQYGVPLKILCNKFVHARYEPLGPTQNPNIPQAKSIVDYIFRWLALKFLSPEDRQSIGMYQEVPKATLSTNQPAASFLSRLDGQNG